MNDSGIIFVLDLQIYGDLGKNVSKNMGQLGLKVESSSSLRTCAEISIFAGGLVITENRAILSQKRH
jgi:hypothetical protein